MKRVIYFASASILLVGSPLITAAASGRRPENQPRDQPSERLCGHQEEFHRGGREMPEADYSFKPGSTPEARTYAQVIAHIAQAQFGQCSGIKGVPNPMAGKQLEQELKTKAEVTKALADLYALCDDLFAQVTDANATEMVKAGQNEVTRAAALYGVIVHGNEMAGTAYVYLRSKNLVPPPTEGRGMRGRGGS